MPSDRRNDRTPFTPPPWWPFLTVGILLGAVAIAIHVHLALEGLAGTDYATLFPTVAPDLPRVALPLIAVLLGGCAAFLGETFRRGEWAARDVALLRGGAVRFRVRPLGLGWLAGWWIVAVGIAVAVSWPAWEATARASEDLWLLQFVDGAVAAGMAGLVTASLVKRLGSRLSRPPAKPRRPSRFWVKVSRQWRLEHWFAFIAGATLGVMPLLGRPAGEEIVPLDALPALVLVAVAAALVSLLLVAGSRAAGVDDRAAESWV